MTRIRCPLNEAARISPNLGGLAGPQGALLYTEVEQCVTATAQLLERRGLRSGERVGFVPDGTWQQVVLFWAILRAHATACPLPAELIRDSGLDHLAEGLRLRFMVGAESCRSAAGAAEWIAPSDLIGFTAPFKRHYRPELDLGAEAVILWTREGGPRPVARLTGDCYYAALSGNATLPFRSRDRWLLGALSDYTGVDTLFRAFISGGIVVADGGRAELEASRLRELEITHLTLSPEQVRDLLGILAASGDLPLKYVLVPGVLPPAHQDALLKNNIVPVMALGGQEEGYVATVDRSMTIHPLKHAGIRVNAEGRLEVTTRDTPWHTTGWTARCAPGNVLELDAVP